MSKMVASSGYVHKIALLGISSPRFSPIAIEPPGHIGMPLGPAQI